MTTPYDLELAALIDAEHYADDLASDARFEHEPDDDNHQAEYRAARRRGKAARERAARARAAEDAWRNPEWREEW